MLVGRTSQRQLLIRNGFTIRWNPNWQEPETRNFQARDRMQTLLLSTLIVAETDSGSEISGSDRGEKVDRQFRIELHYQEL